LSFKRLFSELQYILFSVYWGQRSWSSIF